MEASKTQESQRAYVRVIEYIKQEIRGGTPADRFPPAA